MKKIIFGTILMIFIMSSLVMAPVSAENPAISIYSDQLNVGDVFTWNVEIYTEADSPVSVPSLPFYALEGDVITLELIGDLTVVNAEEVYGKWDYLNLTIDGIEATGETTWGYDNFILPTHAEWDNGTEMHYLEWFFGIDMSFSVKTDETEIIARWEMDFIVNFVEEYRFNKETGVLNSFYTKTTSSSYDNEEILIVKAGYDYTFQEDDSSDGLSFSSPWLLVFALGIPVIIRSQKRKCN